MSKTDHIFGDGMRGSATFSSCGKYRYRLVRAWSPGPRVLFVMLNPSTADAETNDQTVRKCMGFAKSWDFGSMEICNLFGLISPEPRFIKKAEDPRGGVENDAILFTRAMAVAREGGLIVLAWGTWGGLRGRSAEVVKKLRECGIADLHCFGTTKEGYPSHPLYLPYDTEPRIFRGDK